MLDRPSSLTEEEKMNQNGTALYKKLQSISAATREAALLLSEQAKGMQALVDENRNLRALESVWFEQRRTLENLEAAHQATLAEVRRCHQVEVESLKREMQGRLDEGGQRQRELEARIRDQLGSLKQALYQAQVQARRSVEDGGQREKELQSRIVELEARIDAEARVNFQKLAEIEKRHALELEQLQFDYQKSRTFILSSNQRLEEIATRKDLELEEARKQILLLGGDPNRNPAETLRSEIEGLRQELGRMQGELTNAEERVRAREFEVAVLKDEKSMQRKECESQREELDSREDEVARLIHETGILRANQARVEGVNTYLENENRLLRSRVQQLETELKNVALSPVNPVEASCDELGELRKKVENEKKIAARLLSDGANRIIGS
jgi:myosin protein heavy chain